MSVMNSVACWPFPTLRSPATRSAGMETGTDEPRVREDRRPEMIGRELEDRRVGQFLSPVRPLFVNHIRSTGAPAARR